MISCFLDSREEIFYHNASFPEGKDGASEEVDMAKRRLELVLVGLLDVGKFPIGMALGLVGWQRPVEALLVLDKMIDPVLVERVALDLVGYWARYYPWWARVAFLRVTSSSIMGRIAGTLIFALHGHAWAWHDLEELLDQVNWCSHVYLEAQLADLREILRLAHDEEIGAAIVMACDPRTHLWPRVRRAVLATLLHSWNLFLGEKELCKKALAHLEANLTSLPLAQRADPWSGCDDDPCEVHPLRTVFVSLVERGDPTRAEWERPLALARWQGQDEMTVDERVLVLSDLAKAGYPQQAIERWQEFNLRELVTPLQQSVFTRAYLLGMSRACGQDPTINTHLLSRDDLARAYALCAVYRRVGPPSP